MLPPLTAQTLNEKRKENVLNEIAGWQVSRFLL